MDEGKVKCILYHSKASEIIWNEKSLPTNKEVEINWSDVLKLSRIFRVEVIERIKQPYDPKWWKQTKTFGFTADADKKSGYGNCTTNLLKYSALNDCDVRWVGRAYEVPELYKFVNKIIPDSIAMVWHEQPNDQWLRTPFERNIAITPFETTRVPKNWIDKINTFDAMFVPCKQNVDMMYDSEIKIPVELIQWGIDEKLFYPLQRKESKEFTFGTLGSLSIRKGTDLLVRAFAQAFPIRAFPDVRLICKTSSNIYLFASKDKRIAVSMLTVDHNDLIHNFFEKLDVFVLPTRGEGWGLPNTEAMATGIPVITTGWSGPMEYMNDEVGWILNYKLVPAKAFSEELYHTDCGQWAEPDFDDLVDKMRYAYFHQDEVKQKGQNAAEHIKKHFLWKDTIHMFLNALDKYL